MDTLMEALNEALAASPAQRAGNGPLAFTYRTIRAGEGIRRVVWIGGVRDGVAIPSGDVTISEADLPAYDRLIAALRGGRFSLGT